MFNEIFLETNWVIITSVNLSKEMYFTLWENTCQRYQNFLANFQIFSKLFFDGKTQSVTCAMHPFITKYRGLEGRKNIATPWIKAGITERPNIYLLKLNVWMHNSKKRNDKQYLLVN